MFTKIYGGSKKTNQSDEIMKGFYAFDRVKAKVDPSPSLLRTLMV